MVVVQLLLLEELLSLWGGVGGWVDGGGIIRLDGWMDDWEGERPVASSKSTQRLDDVLLGLVVVLVVVVVWVGWAWWSCGVGVEALASFPFHQHLSRVSSSA